MHFFQSDIKSKVTSISLGMFGNFEGHKPNEFGRELNFIYKGTIFGQYNNVSFLFYFFKE